MTQRMTGFQRCIRSAAVAYVDPDHGCGRRDANAIIGLVEYQELRATTAAQGRKRAVPFSRKRGLGYLPQISQPREAHIERLMASASIQGQGDEYRRPTFVIA
jgi:hypothetical protein